MTMQISDGISYQGESFHICGHNGPELFDPTRFKLNPQAPSTACYRGWMGEFEVTDHLLLRDLYIFHDVGLPVKNRSANGPIINEIAPIKPEESWCGFNCFYQGLNIPSNFTGGLLVANQVVKELMVNMGYTPFWKYLRVIELLFQDGKLASATDKSVIAQEIREQHLVSGFLKRSEISNDAAVLRWIEESFSLRYHPM